MMVILFSKLPISPDNKSSECALHDWMGNGVKGPTSSGCHQYPLSSGNQRTNGGTNCPQNVKILGIHPMNVVSF